MPRRPHSRQLSLALAEWSGRRKGAGRKPNGTRRSVSHRTRRRLGRHHPVHVTMRALPEIPSLRVMHRPVREALIAGSKKEDGSFRLVHYAILSNHLHMIVEAADAKSLSRGIQGLAIRIAWAVNRAMKRKRGKVFSDRYHDHQLETARETNLCLAYVLNNYRKHMAESGRILPRGFIDSCSSADYLHRGDRDDCPLPTPETWLLSRGYLEAGGEIDLNKTPGIPRPRHTQRRNTARA
jgi:hypothetical protein